MVSSLVPALRATRIPPVAAMREGATLPAEPRLAPPRPDRRRRPALRGSACSPTAPSAATTPSPRSSCSAPAASAMFFARRARRRAAVVPPLAAVVGAPARRFGGEAGSLASENATRNPIRTAPHRGGADGRPGAGHRRRHPRRRAPLIRPRSARELGRLRLRGHLEERLRTLPGGGGDALSRTPGASLRVQRPQRQGQGRSATKPSSTGSPPNFGRVFNLNWSQGSDAGPRARSAPTARSSKRATPKTTACRSASPFAIRSPSGKLLGLRVTGIQAPSEVQKIDPLVGKVLISRPRLRRLVPAAVEHLQLRQHEGRGDAGQRSRARKGARRPSLTPVAYTKAGWVDKRGQRHRQPAQPPLRAAGALGDRQPLRDGQHAGSLGLRAHPRDRDAARGRHDPPPGPSHDPPGERDHGADRRRTRPAAGHLPRRGLHPGPLRPGDRLLAAGRLADRLHDRRHPRRDPGRGPAGPPRARASTCSRRSITSRRRPRGAPCE